MITYDFGNASAGVVLIQPVDDHDLAFIENEVDLIRAEITVDFRLIAVQIDDWNKDLSPWRAPAVFGKEDFGDGAERTLTEITSLCTDKIKTYFIGGYSLAGLFSLWAAYQTDTFKGVAAASPSMWFPGFADYMKEHDVRSDTVYLSLGDKEEKAKNPVMATVGDRIREAYAWLTECGVNCTLEWNEGNHFKDADIRTAKAFSWIINNPVKKS